MRNIALSFLGFLLLAVSCIQNNSKASDTSQSDLSDDGTKIGSYDGIKSVFIQPRVIDTLLNIDNRKLHFRIYKGKGIPILFENGAGDDCSVWDTILKPIADITETTLITYDRAGFGKSTIDTSETNILKHGVLSGLEDLENALQMLGYNNDIMLVSHSYGGYYTTLYAQKHPDLVKSIVLIDVNHNFYEETAEQEMKEHEKETLEWKKKNIAFYYMAVNLAETSKLMSNIAIPQNIPVVDFVHGISFHETEEKTKRWIKCHKKFIESHPKSIGITAIGCEHYIWFDNPSLVISVIARSYAEATKEENKKFNVYRKTLNYMIEQSNRSCAK